jgi:hypothetical protein
MVMLSLRGEINRGTEKEENRPPKQLQKHKIIHPPGAAKAAIIFLIFG